LPTAVGPRRRRNVHRGQADLAPAGGEHVLPVFGTVPPHLERSPRIDVGRRPEKVLADRPVMAAADRVVARDPLVERYAVRRVVAEVAARRHLAGVLAGGGGEARREGPRGGGLPFAGGVG